MKNNHPRKIHHRPLNPKVPILKFCPCAWAKLLFLRDCGPTEVGGFAIALTDDPLLVTDIQLVDQTCSIASVVFEDDAVADFFDRQVDLGLQPSQFARIWVHTHPGNSPQPSFVDEETFARVFGLTDWALMFILACGGQTYARLQFNTGPGGALEVPVRVEYLHPFPASDQQVWRAEYEAHVRVEETMVSIDSVGGAPVKSGKQIESEQFLQGFHPCFYGDFDYEY